VDGEELERKARVAEILLDAARRLGESLEPERVYECFHELLADVVQHDGVVVSSYDSHDELIRCEYAWVEGTLLDPALLPPLPLNREGGGMQSRVIVSGQPLLFNDVAEQVRGGGTYYDVDASGTMRKLPESGPPGTQAAMMVPVKEEGDVVGVVQLMSDRRAFQPDELELFEGLVGQMAAAVRNVRLQKERRRLEAAEAAARAVAAEREQAAHVLDVVADGIFLLDDAGVVRFWNGAAELVTGVPRGRVQGRPLREAVPEWEGVAARIPVAGGGEPPRSVAIPVEVDGRDLWLSFVAARSWDGVVYAFRDVTRERRLEEEKRDLIATISHELRTPMSAVYGAAQTLLRKDVELAPEQVDQLLRMIAAQSTRLSQITEEVLLATQLDRGDLRVECEPVDVGRLVRETVEALRSRLPEALALEVDVAPELVPAAGDRDRIEQVLVNLLDNAAKYGAAPVVVRVEPANGCVRVSVSDSGPGIAPAEQQRIFEKFYRTGPQLTRNAGGTGLGLYISRELVERMDGRLDVRSEPGAGATFLFELPRA
jgi:two-component system phosphate regulon sensor histidine kinase PhoR